MSGALPWSSGTPRPASNDPTELLQRIEKSTATLAQWMKILVVAVIVLVLINLLFL
jgi:hypothetical protein